MHLGMRGPGSHSHPLSILNAITRQFVPLRPCRSGKAHPPGPSRVASGCLATAPRTQRGSSHSPSTGGKPSPQEGQHLPRGSHGDRAWFSGGLRRFGPGQGLRDYPLRHTHTLQALPRQTRPVALRQNVPAALRRSGVARPPRTSESPGPSLGRALCRVSAAGARENQGTVPRALWWPPRAEAGALVPRAATAGRGRQRPRTPLMKRRPGLAPASPFPQKGSTFGVKPNFCKINEIDRDTWSIKREGGAQALGARGQKPGEAAPSGNGGYCRGGARFRSGHPLRGAAAGPPGRAGGKNDTPPPHPHPGPGPAG